MKEIITANISGIALNIDNDAYAILEEYIKCLQNFYNDKEIEGKEIVDDIEARIAELLLSRLNDIKQPVTYNMIHEIIDTLGMPDEYKIKGEASTPDKKLLCRRLYRNNYGAKIGGVFNGIASYYNFDVTILRVLSLLYVVIFFFVPDGITPMLFIPIIIYLILWVSVPLAQSPRQQLEMTGDKVTAESIEKTIYKEMEKKSNNPNNEKAAGMMTEFIMIIGRFLKFITSFVIHTMGIFSLTIMIATIFIGIYLMSKSEAFFSVLSDSNFTTTMLVIIGSIVVPIIFIILTIYKTVFNMRVRKYIYISLIVLWISLWCTTISYIVKVSMDNIGFKKVETITEIPGDTIYISGEERESDLSRYFYNNILISLDKNYIDIENRNFRLSFKRDSSFIITNTIQSYGKSNKEAYNIISSTPYNVTAEGNSVIFPKYITINSNIKYHGQNISTLINCPKSCVIYISKSFYESIGTIRGIDSNQLKYDPSTGYYKLQK